MRPINRQRKTQIENHELTQWLKGYLAETLYGPFQSPTWTIQTLDDGECLTYVVTIEAQHANAIAPKQETIQRDGYIFTVFGGE